MDDQGGNPSRPWFEVALLDLHVWGVRNSCAVGVLIDPMTL